MQQLPSLYRHKLIGLCSCLLIFLASARSGLTQDGKVWEFAPYDVEIWYDFGPDTQLSAAAKKKFTASLREELQRTFQAAWQVSASALATDWRGTVREHFEDFKLADLARRELVVVASISSEEAKTIRTVDAAVERAAEVATTPAALAVTRRLAERLSIADDSTSARFLELCDPGFKDETKIKAGLKSGKISVALLPRNSLGDIQEDVRVLITSLPWQTETVLRERDKVFFLAVDRAGDGFRLRARELDCPMQFMGPAFATSTDQWPYASRIAATLITRCFAPVARVEDAEATTAELRQRAGGLIQSPTNPAAIRVGDLLQPIVRRDDRNGVPTLLQPLSWTYAAVTQKAEDGVRLSANVYTYSGGPGLRGRQNRRTQRVLLRVRPQCDATDIRLVVRGSQRPQSGCFVYQRDLLTDEFHLLGRTDWRGQFRIEVPTEFGGFLPDEIRRQRLIAKREALQRAAANSELESAADKDQDASESTVQEREIQDRKTEGQSSEQQTVGQSTIQAEVRSEFMDSLSVEDYVVPLNFPLMELYLKNGDTVLAKLPLVPGLKPLEIAELPDDSRRLQTEGFVKGFQGEILDLVGLRNLLAARIKLATRDGDTDKASELLEQMVRLPTYNEMSDRLEAIQRSMLDEQRGTIPLASKRRIDGMFQVTRNMLQKFLQDNLVDEARAAVKSAGGSQ